MVVQQNTLLTSSVQWFERTLDDRLAKNSLFGVVDHTTSPPSRVMAIVYEDGPYVSPNSCACGSEDNGS